MIEKISEKEIFKSHFFKLELDRKFNHIFLLARKNDAAKHLILLIYFFNHCDVAKQLTGLPENIQSQPQPIIHIPELIEKYVESQVADGLWMPHTVQDHRNRIEILYEFFGDKHLTAITREDMRRFRDLVRRLPPNRKKISNFKNRTIDEIASMPHKEVLSVKTVNSILESVSGMFEWAIRLHARLRHSTK